MSKRNVYRDCGNCELREDRAGGARNADMFYPVKEAISARDKVSRKSWKSGLLHRLPGQEGLICAKIPS